MYDCVIYFIMLKTMAVHAIKINLQPVSQPFQVQTKKFPHLKALRCNLVLSDGLVSCLDVFYSQYDREIVIEIDFMIDH